MFNLMEHSVRFADASETSAAMHHHKGYMAMYHFDGLMEYRKVWEVNAGTD